MLHLPYIAKRVAPLAMASVLVVSCKKSPPQAPPAMEVSIVSVAPKAVAVPAEFMGSVEASRSVEVRSQVTGVILDRPYVEGSMVERGAVLFRIDSTSYAGAYRSSQARLADAEARVGNAERNVARLRPLLADNAVARRDVDDAEAELLRSRATVEEARGAVDRAKKDYDDTTVRAQLGGRAGRANFVIGSRVTGSADLLTTIEALDPVYVTFRPPGQQLQTWKRDPRTARVLAPGGGARVQIALADGAVLPRTGRIDFVDPVVDPSTGTQAYRATFSNADHALVPGQFVRIRLLGLTRDSAITIPQRAVQQMLGRQFVFVVAPGDSVVMRDITSGDMVEGQVVVEGLHAGDRVVVDGIQKIGPGSRVRPVPVASSSLGATP